VVNSTRKCGVLGEQIAGAFLALKGYEILDRNRWVGRREIDILARHRGTLVAVEVKLRRTGTFGRAVEGAGNRKLGGIRCALETLARDLGSDSPIRVDVVAIDMDAASHTMTVRLYAGV